MQFPDRSPRPQVSFNELSQWNKCKRILEKNTLIYKNDVNRPLKTALIEDWQNVLSERWVNMLFSSTTNASKEPWFNNNMRKFIIMFLEKYETLSSQEKDDFKNKIISLIQ